MKQEEKVDVVKEANTFGKEGSWQCPVSFEAGYKSAQSKGENNHLLSKVVAATITELKKNNSDLSKILIISGKRSWTGQQIIDSLENKTEDGVMFINNLLQLTLDIQSRQAAQSKLYTEEERIEFALEQIARIGTIRPSLAYEEVKHDLTLKLQSLKQSKNGGTR